MWKQDEYVWVRQNNKTIIGACCVRGLQTGTMSYNISKAE